MNTKFCFLILSKLLWRSYNLALLFRNKYFAQIIKKLITGFEKCPFLLFELLALLSFYMFTIQLLHRRSRSDSLNLWIVPWSFKFYFQHKLNVNFASRLYSISSIQLTFILMRSVHEVINNQLCVYQQQHGPTNISERLFPKWSVQIAASYILVTFTFITFNFKIS